MIEYHEQGMFREKNVAMQELVAKIIALENEAKQFLLNEWVASQK